MFPPFKIAIYAVQRFAQFLFYFDKDLSKLLKHRAVIRSKAASCHCKDKHYLDNLGDFILYSIMQSFQYEPTGLGG
jgi:hypothetical protein